MDVTSNPQEIITVADGIATPDPFRDVIRTEPAPDLQSLIGDIMPYLARHTTTQKMTTTVTTTEAAKISENNSTQHNVTKEEDEEEFSFNKVLELFFYGESHTEKPKEAIRNNTRQTEEPTTSTTEYPKVESKEIINSQHPNSVDSTIGVGLLKLAGCNIYGRMYRVGRIISELSGPCLECKCTEVGVQCTPLKC